MSYECLNSKTQPPGALAQADHIASSTHKEIAATVTMKVHTCNGETVALQFGFGSSSVY